MWRDSAKPLVGASRFQVSGKGTSAISSPQGSIVPHPTRLRASTTVSATHIKVAPMVSTSLRTGVPSAAPSTQCTTIETIIRANMVWTM